MPPPPRIGQLGPDQIRRACIVVLHAPSDAADGQTAWSLSILDIGGVVLARDTLLVPDCPQPLSDIVRPYLDLIGRDVDGEWISDHDAHGDIRHRARIRRAT